jgi:hypothetical protein
VCTFLLPGNAPNARRKRAPLAPVCLERGCLQTIQGSSGKPSKEAVVCRRCRRGLIPSFYTQQSCRGYDSTEKANEQRRVLRRCSSRGESTWRRGHWSMSFSRIALQRPSAKKSASVSGNLIVTTVVASTGLALCL